MIKVRIFQFLIWLLVPEFLWSQSNQDFTVSKADKELQWHHSDFKADGIPGVGAARAYSELVSGKKAIPVIVAIIDSGTETFHADLTENIWINEDEIKGNGKDDDGNGYIDDVHGWSFIGGPGGDVSVDNLEFTRIYGDLKRKYEGKTEQQIDKKDKKEYARYLELKKEYDKRVGDAKAERMQFDMVVGFYDQAKKMVENTLGKKEYTSEEVQAIEAKDEFMEASKNFIILSLTEDLVAQFEEGRKHFATMLDYQLNTEFDPRSMVGDNYDDLSQKNYGNNHIDGPHSDHGTHVGGIVGATRNAFGMDGLAAEARLMVVRCVPDGDERDKDVANAIRYAVDNGARIINMSFGKSFSPQKQAVDEAARYAESKGVLLIHAAGNDAKNIDKAANFPNDKYENGKYCKTWIEIGASGPNPASLAADFSNYGKNNVDVFSPGVDIFSTLPDGKYGKNSGTSMAAPVAVGVAAVIMSYYPLLTALDVKAIMLKSASDFKNQEVTMPGNPEKMVKFKTLSKTGGVVNLYNALQMAATWKAGSAKK